MICFLGAARTLGAMMTTTVHIFAIFLVTATAFGVMGIGLTSTAAMLALFDRATLGVDVMKLAIWSRISFAR